MDYKKVSTIMLFMSFSLQAASLPEENKLSNNIAEQQKNNKNVNEDIDDVITVIARSSS
ncbi:hypothetical protein [Gilliamella apis]|uniref:hypothetical protein n=1 Tax=Gilliamella apis TaxID=1970738 RepID=UPI0013FDECE2|nr:hypothetical protein [Gilliamella apis]